MLGKRIARGRSVGATRVAGVVVALAGRIGRADLLVEVMSSLAGMFVGAGSITEVDRLRHAGVGGHGQSAGSTGGKVLHPLIAGELSSAIGDRQIIKK